MVVFKSFFGTSNQSEIMTSALDLATSAAGYASNTSEIESLIHETKLISSQISSAGLLTAEDEEALFDIYLKLERYLATADPIRKFDKAELRSKASKGLRSRLEAYENKVSQQKSQTVAFSH
jgi:hypothetical protein